MMKIRERCLACGSDVRDIRFDIKLHSAVMGEHWMTCFHPWHDRNETNSKQAGGQVPESHSANSKDT